MSNPRPLSPHLQVYKPQLTSLLSIVHRTTGVALACGSLLIAWWLWRIAGGAESYALARQFFASSTGNILLIVWTWCAFYHMCNGVRHLFWDLGLGFELSQVYLSGRAVVFFSVALTAFVWWYHA